MIAGVGTDIVEIQRVAASLQRFGSAFRNRVFTPAELEEARLRNEAPSFYAGRWAAKEAAAKALGSGIGAQCAFTEIEILSGEHGAPQLTFSGRAAETAARLGAKRLHISISHERAYAVAFVVLE